MPIPKLQSHPEGGLVPAEALGCHRNNTRAGDTKHTWGRREWVPAAFEVSVSIPVPAQRECSLN